MFESQYPTASHHAPYQELRSDCTAYRLQSYLFISAGPIQEVLPSGIVIAVLLELHLHGTGP